MFDEKRKDGFSMATEVMGEGQEGHLAAAKELLDAIKADDHKAVAAAIKNAYDLHSMAGEE